MQEKRAIILTGSLALYERGSRGSIPRRSTLRLFGRIWQCKGTPNLKRPTAPSPILPRSAGGPSQRSVSSILVKRLFGRYSYDLSLSSLDAPDPENLMILYGDNGSGKTTILRLVFHLLSAADGKGHKTYISNVPFQLFQVGLEDGTTITAERSDGALTGSFSASITRGAEVIASVVVDPSPATGIKYRVDSDRECHFVESLDALGIDLYYLSDDRRVYSDKLAPHEEEDMPIDLVGTAGDIILSRRPTRPGADRTATELRRAINRATEWIQKQAREASSIGEINVNTIYADVARRIASSSDSENTSFGDDITGLSSRLRELSERSKAFAEYGLVTTFSADEFERILSAARSSTYHVLYSVLQPYVDGTQARLNALQEIQIHIERFVKGINAFYTDKALRFDLHSGITIESSDGVTLTPDMLSSGEKQLLLLLCHTLYARDQAAIFIVDEPELSLNIKWQRKLVDTLLEFATGSQTQFLMATHSVELVTKHIHHVVRLRTPGED